MTTAIPQSLTAHQLNLLCRTHRIYDDVLPTEGVQPQTLEILEAKGLIAITYLFDASARTQWAAARNDWIAKATHTLVAGMWQEALTQLTQAKRCHEQVIRRGYRLTETAIALLEANGITQETTP